MFFNSNNIFIQSISDLVFIGSHINQVRNTVWDNYRKEIIDDVSITYLCMFIAVLLVFCFIAIKRFNYDNVAEIAS